METVPHPYYPLGLKVVGYEANQWHSITLISFFASACATIFLATYLVVTKVRPKLTKSDLWTILWFVLCKYLPFYDFENPNILMKSKPGAFVFSLRDIMYTTFDQCQTSKISLVKLGNYTLYLILATNLTMLSRSVWRLSLLSFGVHYVSP